MVSANEARTRSFMKTISRPHKFVWWWWLALGAIAVLAGCATKRQIEDAVARSNYAIVSASAGLGPAQPQSGSAADWREAAAKLENLIAEHPGNPQLVAALRLRQAVLYLHARQFHLAEAAFDEVRLADLRSSRDLALKSLQTSLLWWYAAADGTFSRHGGAGGRDDFLQASNALVELHQQWVKLKAPEDQGIRDYLALMRAFVGVKLANDIVGVDVARAHLTNTLNFFSAMLPPGETERWLNFETNWPPENLALDTALLPKLRRRFETEAVLKAAVIAIHSNAVSGPFAITNAYFMQRIEL